jgi:hypothetical protein
MRLIAETISQVPASKTRPWEERIVLGIWATKYLPLCHTYLPDYSISYIGFSTTYARQFLSVPNISFNMIQAVLIGPMGSWFIRDAKKLRRPVFAWTVNHDNRMQWCIRKGLDGVFTDDPKRFLELCAEWVKNPAKERFGFRDWLDVIRIQVFATIFVWLFRYKFGWGIDPRFVRRASVLAAAAEGR